MTAMSEAIQKWSCVESIGIQWLDSQKIELLKIERVDFSINSATNSFYQIFFKKSQNNNIILIEKSKHNNIILVLDIVYISVLLEKQCYFFERTEAFQAHVMYKNGKKIMTKSTLSIQIQQISNAKLQNNYWVNSCDEFDKVESGSSKAPDWKGAGWYRIMGRQAPK